MLIKLCIFTVMFWGSASYGASLGTVSFHADGFPVMDIDSNDIPLEGSQKVSGGKLSGTYKVNLKKFETDLDDRDAHMQKLMEVNKFPIATFRLDPVVTSGTQNFKGTMDFHGFKRRVKGIIKFSGKTAIAKFNINTTEFKLKRAFYEVVKVAEVVNVQVLLMF